MSTVLDFKSVLIALLPEGHIWNPKPGGDFDLMQDAEAENIQLIYDRLAAAADVRNPRKTTMLSDLEKEYRTVPESVLTEDERRIALANIMYQPICTGAADFLQARLQENGFDLVVRQNSPAIDPRILADVTYQMMADGGAAFAGNAAAFAGLTGGELIVNQDQYSQEIAYEAQANGAAMFAANQYAIAGFFNNLNRDIREYDLGMHFGYWSCVFFIAGGFSGWTPLADWNMEKPGNTNWLPGVATNATKDTFALEQDSDNIVSEYEMYSDVYNEIEDLVGTQNGINYDGVNVEGQFGRAISFDGVSAYVYFNMSLDTYTSVTLEVIAKVHSDPTDSFVPLLGERATANERTGIYIDNNGNVVVGLGLTSPLQTIVGPRIPIEKDRYYHFVMTWTNGGTLNLYIDGYKHESRVFYTGTLDLIELITAKSYVTPDYLDCEVAYCAFYSEEKNESWVQARFFNVMREGGRRLQVSAINNTQNQQLSPPLYLPHVYADYGMYNYPVAGVEDSLENHGKLTLTGGANINDTYGRAISLNGTSDKLSGLGYVFRGYGTKELTIEIVAKIDNYPATQSMIVGSTNGAGDGETAHGILVTTTAIQGRLTMSGDTPYYTTSYAMSTTGYHHIAMAWKSGETIKLYVDGSLVAQSSVATGTIDSFTGISIGVDENGGSPPYYLDCKIGRFTIYDRQKDLSYIQSRYNALITRKVCDLVLYDPGGNGFGPSGYNFRIQDLTNNQYGDPDHPLLTNPENAWSKYGRSLLFDGSATFIDLYTDHPAMASVEQTIVVVLKKNPGSTPALQYIVSNNTAGATQALYLDLSSYPTITLAYEMVISSVHYTKTTDVSNIEDEYLQIIARRFYDTVNTRLALWVNGSFKGELIQSGLVDVSSTACMVGKIGSSNYFDGELCQLKMYNEYKDSAWVISESSIFASTDMENGSYAEQILETPITESRDIEGVAWGDDTSATPYLMIQDPDTLQWQTIWSGDASPTAQHFTATAPNGLSAIRLYNGLSEEGFVSFDDINLIDPQVTRGQVSAARKDKLKQLILQYKPLGTWCVLITDYV